MAMTQAFGTFFAAALKQLYGSTRVEDLTSQDNVLYGILPKQSGFGGESQPLIMQYANTQAVNVLLSQAQTDSDVATPESVSKFAITRVRKYGVARLEQEAIEATATDKMSFLNLLKTRLDGLFQTFANRMETQLFRNHTGHIGVIGSITSSGTDGVITLSQVEEIVNFEIGMTLVADDTSTMQSLRTDEASGAISAVNRVDGKITVTGLYGDGGSTDWAANDYLAVLNDIPTSTTHASARCVSGLDTWCPSAAPSGASNPNPATIFGVDRTADSRLYGQVHDGSAESLEEALIKAQSKAAREGGAPSVALMINAQYRKLVLELGSKRVISEVNARTPQGLSTRLGFRAIEVEGDAGVIKVVAARRCQANVAWLLKPEDWQLLYLGKEPIGFIPYPELDGKSSALKFLRLASDDGVEARVAFRGNLLCSAPNRQVRVGLATP